MPNPELRKSAPFPETGEGSPVSQEIPTTDLDILRREFGDRAYPVATDRFLGKSKKKYDRPAWLAREIAQNFIDQNPGGRHGTLDGVEILSEEIPSKGARRFIVRGPWEFKDPTGLITLHSEKPEEVETAGGNGIGVKQTALILFRDFHVSHFYIDGQKWKVNYRLVSPAETAELRHNWLIAQYGKSANQGSCAYTIETDNPEIIKALNELPNVAVCAKNEFLQDPDFANEKGAIKWLPPKSDKERPGVGRLFMNGQVMDVADGPDSNGWQGLRGATLRLNDIQYTMSMDRPPLNNFAIGMYARQLVDTMNSKDLMDQLSRSEKIWAGAVEDKENSPTLEIVERIVSSLKWKFIFPEYNKKKDMETLSEEVKQYFIQKKYLARESGISRQDEEKLVQEGYVLCPRFFSQIGMPSVLEKIVREAVEAPAAKTPDAAGARRARAEAAEKSGVEVGYEDFGNFSPEEFAQAAKERLRPFLKNAEASHGILRVELSEYVPSVTHLKIMAARNSEEGRIVSAIRSIAAFGLSRGIFTSVAVFEGGNRMSFGVDREEGGGEVHLFVRKEYGEGNGKGKGVFLSFGLKQEFLPLFQDFEKEAKVIRKEGGEAGEKAQDSSRAHVGAPEFFRSKLGKRVAAASLSALMALGGWFALEKSGAESSRDAEKSSAAPAYKNRNVPGRARIYSGKPSAAASSGDQEIPHETQGIEAQKSFGESSEVKKFKEWNEDRRKKALADARYPRGRMIENIMIEYNRANVPPGREPGGEQVSRPVSPDEVKNFEILREPTDGQLVRLGILRDAVYMATGVKIDNKLFIYRGRGASGMNILGQGIGIHEGVINGAFLEAFGTFVHEVAHNAAPRSGHGVTFQIAMEDLFLETDRRLILALAKSNAGAPLSKKDRAILDLAHEWEKTPH